MASKSRAVGPGDEGDWDGPLTRMRDQSGRFVTQKLTKKPMAVKRAKKAVAKKPMGNPIKPIKKTGKTFKKNVPKLIVRKVVRRKKRDADD